MASPTPGNSPAEPLFPAEPHRERERSPFSLYYRNGQLLVLTVLLIVVWGASAFFTLPRLEDPEIVERNATVTVQWPGASAERVESLVAEKLEDPLFELEEVAAIESVSRQGIAVVSVELKDDIRDPEPVWSKVRGKIDDAEPDLPEDASEPEFEVVGIAASAAIVGPIWERDAPPNYAILNRLTQTLEDRLRSLPGTAKVERFGVPEEEIRVTADPAELADRGLSAIALADRLRESDAKVPAGQQQGTERDFALALDSEFDSLARVRETPVGTDERGQTVRVGDVATVAKGIREPARELAWVAGRPAIALAVTVDSDRRVDRWAEAARSLLAESEATLPEGVGLHWVLDQSRYVSARIDGVSANLVLGSVLVFAVSFLMLGWRVAIAVGAALPLSALATFGAMRALNIPLQQMSVTGIIIALGLLIDNAIVVADAVKDRLHQGDAPAAAVARSTSQLAVPLTASTLTTVLAFLPIATSSGGTGEFIGTIGSTTILALVASLVLSLTVVAALAARLLAGSEAIAPDRSPSLWRRWRQEGVGHPRLASVYGRGLHWLLGRPWLAIAACLLLPGVGFAQFAQFDRQFFPPTNRDQFRVELELPQAAAIAQTRDLVLAARDRLRQHPAVAEVHWFLGESAPRFFYNVVADRENAPHYAQGIVQLSDTDNLRQTLQALQADLDAAFPQARALVRQLEQGPPVAAPIELRLYGSDLSGLQRWGDRLRSVLVQQPATIHARTDLGEVVPQVTLAVDEVRARRAGLTAKAIARQLDAALAGRAGGAVLEGTEELPVRVRVDAAERGDLAAIASLELLPPAGGDPVALDRVAAPRLEPQLAQIARYNGQRVNAVRGYLAAGELPARALARFERDWAASGLALPPGYRLEYGGEADARSDSVANLLSTASLLAIAMTAVLVLSFNSFRMALLVALVAVLGAGWAFLALRVFGALFGFAAILGILGLVGLAVNDSIVVLSNLRADPRARRGQLAATVAVTHQATRHVLATTLTTLLGFLPLMLDPTGFWPPLAIAVGGGLAGATTVALAFLPAAHRLLVRVRLGRRFGRKLGRRNRANGPSARANAARSGYIPPARGEIHSD